ncbi:FeoA family protein [uncultured Sphingomonas sp.]|uniref:FeoA family protein n=1 Tax=uncultured Sphingomonas sp. TaxID=158754 RepID=UPI0025E96DEE|nr:FeoA family protein [uncultured Sphingomonas sp.]
MLSPTLSLVQLSRDARAVVQAVDWQSLSLPEARRLRELGLDEGVAVEMVHRSTLGGGPIACRIGRMTIAIRRHVARAIHVAPAS